MPGFSVAVPASWYFQVCSIPAAALLSLLHFQPVQASNQSRALHENITYRNYNEVYLLSEGGWGKGSSVSCVGSQIGVFPGIYRKKSWSHGNLYDVLVVVSCEPTDLEIFLRVDLKRQLVIDFAIDHLCNRENSPVKLFFHFSGKLKYLALSDQVLYVLYITIVPV